MKLSSYFHYQYVIFNLKSLFFFFSQGSFVHIFSATILLLLVSRFIGIFPNKDMCQAHGIKKWTKTGCESEKNVIAWLHVCLHTVFFSEHIWVDISICRLVLWADMSVCVAWLCELTCLYADRCITINSWQVILQTNIMSLNICLQTLWVDMSVCRLILWADMSVCWPLFNELTYLFADLICLLTCLSVDRCFASWSRLVLLVCLHYVPFWLFWPNLAEKIYRRLQVCLS